MRRREGREERRGGRRGGVRGATVKGKQGGRRQRIREADLQGLASHACWGVHCQCCPLPHPPQRSPRCPVRWQGTEGSRGMCTHSASEETGRAPSDSPPRHRLPICLPFPCLPTPPHSPPLVCQRHAQCRSCEDRFLQTVLRAVVGAVLQRRSGQKTIARARSGGAPGPGIPPPSGPFPEQRKPPVYRIPPEVSLQPWPGSNGCRNAEERSGG